MTGGAEASIVLSGIGGQGVQLLAKVLARAALAQGKHAMLASEYGGEMRGGRSFASVVLGEGPLHALPVIEHADSAIVLHHLHWRESDHLLRPGALVVVEQEAAGEIVPAGLARDPARRYLEVAARRCAEQVGSAMGAGFALLGAYCAITGAAAIDGLVAAMAASTPPYRQAHVAGNERALRAGAELGAAMAGAPA